MANIKPQTHTNALVFTEHNADYPNITFPSASGIPTIPCLSPWFPFCLSLSLVSSGNLLSLISTVHTYIKTPACMQTYGHTLQLLSQHLHSDRLHFLVLILAFQINKRKKTERERRKPHCNLTFSVLYMDCLRVLCCNTYTTHRTSHIQSQDMYIIEI